VSQPYPWVHDQGKVLQGSVRKPWSEGKCEGMNPHTPKGTPTLGNWTPHGLPNLQRAIVEVKTHWIEQFFISLKSY